MIKKGFLYLFLLVFVGGSSIFFVDSSLAAEKVDNNYIIEFYKEKGEEQLDPEEETIILEALEDYWESDLEVADILAKAKNDYSLKDIVLSTDEKDKINAVKIIENIYDNVVEEEQQLLYEYIERHAKGIDDKGVLEFLETLDTKYRENQVSLAAAYKGTGAATWAYNNYNKYSASYPKFTGSFGTNCTNFISQAMHVGGGISKQGAWTISRKNTKYHVINSAAQLNHSWSLKDPSPWISVKEFSKFWRSKSTVRGVSKSQYTQFPQNYRSQKLGDIVILSKGVAGVVTVPTHAMIITQVTASDYNLAGNTTERQKHPLKTAISAYSYVEFFRPN